jgi:signal transduction histidine kinase
MSPKIEIFASDHNLVIALEQARQRIEALKKEFAEATDKLASVNQEIKGAAEKYSTLKNINAELEAVNAVLGVATTKLTFINEQIILAQAEAGSLHGTKEELSRVNDELTKATFKLATVNKDLKEATEYVEKLQAAKLELEAVNLQVTEANLQLASVNQQLKEAHAVAVQASKLKAEFLANMSHEIRTPMSGMIGMCEMLLLTNLEEDSKGMANDVFRSAKNLLLIVNQLLDFSKLEAGKMEPESVKFSITAVLERVVSLILVDADRKGLAVKIAVEPAVPVVAVGDELRIERILLNIAHNAVKFTESGEIRIAAEVLSQTKSRFNLRISITDTGIGISEEAQKLLFEPFVQADGSTTRRYGGTGLGLSIAKRLATLLSGNIEVTSTEGEGSTFSLSLPLEQAQ